MQQGEAEQPGQTKEHGDVDGHQYSAQLAVVSLLADCLPCDGCLLVENDSEHSREKHRVENKDGQYGCKEKDVERCAVAKMAAVRHSKLTMRLSGFILLSLCSATR